jgi:hypothetical protein
MTVYLDHPLPEGPILAGGKATFDGEMLAEEYKEIVDTIAALDARREVLRALIIQAAQDEDPKAKSFPAGQRVIKISHSTRRSIAVTAVERDLPEVYDALVAGGMVKTTESVSVKVD